MHAPTLRATYQPNASADDHEWDVGAPVPFDAGRALLSLGADDVRAIASQVGRPCPTHLDALAEAAGLLAHGEGHHGGRSHVTIDAVEVRTFLRDLWIEDVDTLTDDDVASVRSAYAAMTVEAMAA